MKNICGFQQTDNLLQDLVMSKSNGETFKVSSDWCEELHVATKGAHSVQQEVLANFSNTFPLITFMS